MEKLGGRLVHLYATDSPSRSHAAAHATFPYVKTVCKEGSSIAHANHCGLKNVHVNPSVGQTGSKNARITCEPSGVYSPASGPEEPDGESSGCM